jgi:hypothetical protein
MHITADSIVRARIEAIILALIGILPSRSSAFSPVEASCSRLD